MQRAVAIAALASNGRDAARSVIRRPSFCADSRAALALAEALGAGVKVLDDRVEIAGATLEGRMVPPNAESPNAESPILPRRVLDCGESGLCMRMFAPIAALFPGESELVGRGSLRRRPVTAIEGCLASLGAFAGTSDGLPPVLVRGPMSGGTACVDATASSQFLSGLLIALPLAPADSELSVPGLVSPGYIGLTLDTMSAFGLEVEAARDYSGFLIRGGRSYRPADFTVEGDWSGAAFLLVAGALAARRSPLAVRGLGLASSQPDRAILAALEAAGASVESGAAKIAVMRRRLRAFDFDASGCPDLFPPLVALASACEGVTHLSGATRLATKESDRAAALSEEFGKMGIDVKVSGDDMWVRGGSVKPGRVDSRGDHRIAMAAAVAALSGEGEVIIGGAECVSKSWPGFFEDLGSITATP
jgi:3-phosphoshikimate 1-carboxyvinyltransferase